MTGPEQLIAAAYVDRLSKSLTRAGSPPDSVGTYATVTKRLVDGVSTITNIALLTVGRVPGIDGIVFTEQALVAKAAFEEGSALPVLPRIKFQAILVQ